MDRRLVLDDRREASRRREEEIVGRVVVDRRDFADDRDARAGLGVEFVIEERRQPDRLAGADDETMSGGNAVRDAVERNADFAVVEASVAPAVVDLADEIAAGPADDVLLLDGVAMHRRALAFADDHRLLAIDGAPIGRRCAAVADGEGGEADMVEVAGGEVGDVPAELADADRVAFLALLAPRLRRPEGERRQMEVVLVEDRLGARDGGVDFGALHRDPPVSSVGDQKVLDAIMARPRSVSTDLQVDCVAWPRFGDGAIWRYARPLSTRR
jgi:hypothetical protein